MLDSPYQGSRTGLPPPISTSVPGTPARLASLGPVGPPLTARLASLDRNDGLRGRRNPATSRGFPTGSCLAPPYCSPDETLKHPGRGAPRNRAAPPVGSTLSRAPRSRDRLAEGGLTGGGTFHKPTCTYKPPAQRINPCLRSPTIIHGASHFDASRIDRSQGHDPRSRSRPRSRTRARSPLG